ASSGEACGWRPPQTSLVVLRRARAGERPGRHSHARRGPGAVARGRRRRGAGAPLGPRVVDARARGGVPADHRRGGVPTGARAVRRRRHAELSMQRRARVSGRSRHRERRDAVEPRAVAGWRRCLSQRRSRNSRGHPPGAERPHGPPPETLPRAPHRCRQCRARAARNGQGVAAELPGVEVVPSGPETFEVTVPPPLDGGHETHFARVLDEFLTLVDAHHWPSALAERTLAKYTLLAEAAARTRAER